MLRKSVGKIIKEGKEEDVENELEKVSKTCPETHDSMPIWVLGPGTTRLVVYWSILDQ